MIYMRLQNLQQARIAGRNPGMSCLFFSPPDPQSSR